jgi:hypothetical protein
VKEILSELFEMPMIYFIPAYRIEIVKRLPLISLPTAWNSAPGDKYNVKQHLYLKNLKELLLAAL